MYVCTMTAACALVYAATCRSGRDREITVAALPAGKNNVA
jgi:hypothetical protein